MFARYRLFFCYLCRAKKKNMGIFEIILIAIALAMDCFAVSVACGMTNKSSSENRFFLRMAFLFGLFHVLMPLLGYCLIYFFKDFVEVYTSYISFAILTILGLKMIKDTFSSSKSIIGNIQQLNVVLLLVVATSIDAMATGFLFVSFSVCKLIFSLLIIGFFSFCFSLIGYGLGKYSIKFFSKFPAEVVGGIILIFLGIKMLCVNF